MLLLSRSCCLFVSIESYHCTRRHHSNFLSGDFTKDVIQILKDVGYTKREDVSCPIQKATIPTSDLNK
jgi:hypothetical protein